MKLNDKGGIEVYVAAEKPEGVPEENWLPIKRKDEDMDMVLRIYVPDLEKFKTLTPANTSGTLVRSNLAAARNRRNEIIG
jgi:hypothetical protein